MSKKKGSKKIFFLLLCIVICISLTGCSGKYTIASQVTTDPLTSRLETNKADEPYYLKEVNSKYSSKNYLNFDNSSWKRENKPEFVMVHFMSGVTVNKDDPYQDDLIRSIFEDYEIGINYVIKRDGTIECLLPENRAAWHAGEGVWGDDPKYTNLMNKYSIGIEILAIGSQNDMEQYLSYDEYNSLNPKHIGFTDEQYKSLKLLLEDICVRQQIPFDRQHIIGHEEYSESKTDPGELFDWSKIGL